MNIGMLLNAPYPSDVRVKKETDALLKAGHTIFLLCLRRNNEMPAENYNGIHITRLDAGKNDIHLAFWDSVMSMTFIHPVFKKHLPDWLRINGIKVLHVHDLPLVGTALAMRKKLNVKVIADFHENYPDALETWFMWTKNPITKLKNALFMRPKRWVKHERKATLNSDHVIAVVDEMKNRLITDYGVSENKITVVTNSEERTFIEQPLDPSIYKDFTSKFIITYSGGIGPHRGIDTAIRGMQYVKNKKDIVFVIIGSGSKATMNSLRKLVVEFGLQDQVFFLGYQHFSKFNSFMHYASVNVIPHKSTRHTDNTIPHKLFQGMMIGKPLLVSSSAPLKRVITQTNAGLVFQADDAKDFSEKVLELYNDEALRKDLSRNGIKATLEGDLNWESEQIKLIHLYSQLERTISTQ